MLKRFFTLCLFGVIGTAMYASHYQGIEMYAQCLDSCTYRIYHISYLNCTGTTPGTFPPPNISFAGVPQSCTVNPQLIGSWVSGPITEISPVCPSQMANTTCSNPGSQIPGMVQVLYYADYDMCSGGFPNCNQVQVIHQTCCRNTTIVSGAANDGIYVTLDIPLGTNICNNSPVFNTPARSLICAGTVNTMDMSATDADGDSLVYSLSSCYQNSNVPVGYSFGYSPQSFLGPSWSTSIDPVTGLLTMAPNPTGFAVNGVVCVTVDEYRNGLLIGSVNRDFIINAYNCMNSPITLDTLQNINGLSQTGVNTFEACPGMPVSFEVVASDINSQDNITITSNVGSIFSNATTNLVGTNPAVYQVSFIPTSQSSGTTNYIQIMAEDDGCPFVSTQWLYIAIDMNNSCINATTTSTNCGTSNGAIDISLVSATPPIQYLWNTGDTTEDLSGIPTGIYWVTATDSTGFVFTDTLIVDGSDIIITDSIVSPSCDSINGSIYVSISGGSGPYTYSWTTGATTPDIHNLGAGGYTVYVTDTTGCIKHKPIIISQANTCAVAVSGRAYLDQNNNCVFDAGDYPLVNAYIDFSPGGATFTDTSGYYSVLTDTGTFTINYYNPIHPAAACGPGNVQILSFTSYGDDTMGVDFPIDTVLIKDLKINGVTQGNLSPGFNHFYNLQYRNLGTVIMDGTVSWTHDDSINFVSSNPVGVYDSTNNTVTWNFSNLSPGEIRTINILGYVPLNVSTGTPLTTTVVINPITGDIDTVNNTFSWLNTVGQSLDPNDKRVIPAGIGSQGFIQQKDSILTYNIRFQNTGTLPATFVIIEDSIDDDLDITSISMGAASHPYSATIEDDKKLVFTFDNINLPDSVSDPMGSQGFIQFSIKQKPHLPLGTEITNQVGIIFDFNEPVITNEVINTIFDYPEITILAASDTLCKEDSISAKLTNLTLPPYTYQWINLNQSQNTADSIYSVELTTSDLYQVVVIDALGFSDTATQYIHVSEEPVADFSFQTNIGTVDFTDLSQGASEWQWDFGDSTFSNDQNPQHVYSTNGTYTVTLITTNDCGQNTTTQFVEIGSVSIFPPLSDNRFAHSVKIAPNPFSESVKISFENPMQVPVELIFMDAKGRKVLHKAPQRTESFSIVNEGLAPGIYLVKITGPGQFIGKIMVR